MDKRDNMDRLLSRLGRGKTPAGLEEKIRNNFRRRYHKHLAVQYVLSIVMVSAGIWLLGPWFAGTTGLLNLPHEPFSILTSLPVRIEPVTAMIGTWQSLASVQSRLSSSIGVFHWLGLVSLSAGSLLGLNSLLPSRK